MAKAASAAVEGYSKERHGAGWKACPACGGYVKGPLTKECPSCHHKFQFRSKLVRKGNFTGGNPAVETENKLMLAALKMGGIDKLAAAVKKLSEDPVIALAIELGGIEKTQQAVDTLGSRIKNG